MSLSLAAIYPETKSEGLSSDDVFPSHTQYLEFGDCRPAAWVGAATSPLLPVEIGGKEL